MWFWLSPGSAVCAAVCPRAPPLPPGGHKAKLWGCRSCFPSPSTRPPSPPASPSLGSVTVGPADGVCVGLSCSVPPSPCSERTEVAKTGFRSCWGVFLLGEGAVKHICRGRQPQHTPLRAAAAGLCLISERLSAHTQQREGRRLRHARPPSRGVLVLERPSCGFTPGTPQPPTRAPAERPKPCTELAGGPRGPPPTRLGGTGALLVAPQVSSSAKLALSSPKPP